MRTTKILFGLSGLVLIGVAVIFVGGIFQTSATPILLSITCGMYLFLGLLGAAFGRMAVILSQYELTPRNDRPVRSANGVRRPREREQSPLG